MFGQTAITHGAVAAGEAARPMAAPAAETAVDRAAEAVWVAGQRKAWSSLVLVPTEPGLPVAPLARAVAAVGSAQRGEPVELLDLRGRPLADSRPFAETLADAGERYRRVAALDCPLESQTARLLATSADAAVLVVVKERTSLAAARRVLDLLGLPRFLGAVVLDPVRR